EEFFVDGGRVSPPAGITPFKTLEISQKTLIDWSSSGGGKLEVFSTHEFCEDSGYTLRYSFDGAVSSSFLYSAMHTTPETFSEVIYPNFLDVSTMSNGSFRGLKRSNII